MPKKDGDKDKAKAAKAAEKAAREEEARKQAELDRLRREEEARLAAEAEAERQENLRLAREAEKRRLASEHEQDIPVATMRQMRLADLLSSQSRAADWQAFVECSPLPLAHSDADINTFLSIFEQEPPGDLEHALKEAQTCEDIIHQLDNLWAGALEERQPLKVARCIEFSSKLRAAAAKKIDAATAACPLITHAESHDDTKITELQEQTATNDLRLGLWVRATPAGQQGTRLKPVVFPDLGAFLELPKSLATLSSGGAFTTLALRVLYSARDPLAVLNQGALVSIGGVVMVQFLGVPPPPQFMREWTLREVTEATESCQLKPYPGPPDTGGTVQTIRIAYTLPKAMLFTPDQLQVAFFDAAESQWRLDGLTITDAKFNAADRSLSFLMMANRLAPVTVVQPRTIDLPYSGWGVIPLSESRCQLHIATPRFLVVFDIHDDRVSLLQPNLPALSDVLHRPMRPGRLLRALAAIGLMLLPDERDALHLQRTPKEAALEARVHEQIAQLVPSFEVRGCELNPVGGADRIFFQSRACGAVRRAEYARQLSHGRIANTTAASLSSSAHHGGSAAAAASSSSSSAGMDDDSAAGERPRTAGGADEASASGDGIGNDAAVDASAAALSSDSAEPVEPSASAESDPNVIDPSFGSPSSTTAAAKSSDGISIPQAGDDAGLWRSALATTEKVMLFKPEVRPGRQPAPKVDPLFGHGDPDALAAPAADEQQKPMSPKEKKESARKKKEQAAAEAASAAAAAAASRPATVGENDEDGQPRVTYIPAALIHTINDEWQFENSHTSALRCAMAAAAPSEAADAMANCSETPNLKMQDVLRRLLNLVRPLSFEQMP